MQEKIFSLTLAILDLLVVGVAFGSGQTKVCFEKAIGCMHEPLGQTEEWALESTQCGNGSHSGQGAVACQALTRVDSRLSTGFE